MSTRSSGGAATTYVVALSHPDQVRRRELRTLLRASGYCVVPLGAAVVVDAQIVGSSDAGEDLQDVPTLFVVSVGDPAAGPRPGFAPTDVLEDDPERNQELVLRIGVLCRQHRMAAAALSEGLTVDDERRVAITSAGKVALTFIEHRLLRALAARTGTISSRRSLVVAVWPTGARVARNTVDSHIRRLRSKLASIGAPLRIETVYGDGFRLVLRAV